MFSGYNDKSLHAILASFIVCYVHIVNPILKKLSNSDLSRLEIAGLLEKHIGDGSNECHCQDACDALRRIHDQNINSEARVLVALLDGHWSPCEAIKWVIANLRGGR